MPDLTARPGNSAATCGSGRAMRGVCLVALLSIVAAQASSAAEPPAVQAARKAVSAPTCSEKVASLKLATLPGTPKTLYGQGYESRAAMLQARLRDARAFMAGQLGVHPDLTLVVVGEADWQRGCQAQPYGIPYAWLAGGFVWMAGDTDNFTSRAYAAIGPALPPALRATIERPGRDFTEAARQFTDLIGFHEVGHVFANAYGIYRGNEWLDEFIASYLAYDYLLAKSPDDAALFQAMNTAFSSGPAPEHTSLDDFNRLYMGVGAENYGWYQGQFQRRVADVHARRGIGFIRALKSANLQRGTDPAALLRGLDRIDTGFGAWAESLKRLSGEPK